MCDYSVDQKRPKCVFGVIASVGHFGLKVTTSSIAFACINETDKHPLSCDYAPSVIFPNDTTESERREPKLYPLNRVNTSNQLTMDRLDLKKQMGYFAYSLRTLPSAYGKLDTNRLTLVHFCVHALDLLHVWDQPALLEELHLEKSAIIDWIYALQVTSDQYPPEMVGFKGGAFLGGSFDPEGNSAETSTAPRAYNHGHIAMTYTALCTLKVLGDDWSRVDKEGIIRALPYLQRPDGSFQCIAVGSEHDMRFLYCACSISYMLQDWSGVDVARACAYIRNCRSWDGAFGLIPGQEGHGGSTFTAVASMVLMNQLDHIMDEEWRSELIYWCIHRQVGGMQGRPNKAEDTCYSYWIGGTLRLLQADNLLNHEKLVSFVLQCQTPMGGFSKIKNAYPDVLHAYYSLAYLSLSQGASGYHDESFSIKKLNCTLGIGDATAKVFEPNLP